MSVSPAMQKTMNDAIPSTGFIKIRAIHNATRKSVMVFGTYLTTDIFTSFNQAHIVSYLTLMTTENNNHLHIFYKYLTVHKLCEWFFAAG